MSAVFKLQTSFYPFFDARSYKQGLTRMAFWTNLNLNFNQILEDLVCGEDQVKQKVYNYQGSTFTVWDGIKN